jgi:uncharacterized protein (TIGR03118 family)
MKTIKINGLGTKGKSALMGLLCVGASVSGAYAKDLAKDPVKSLVFEQTNFVANTPNYGATTVDKDLINAWGIAIRPAGAGGHFWVTGKDISFEYVGDVTQSPDEKLRTLHTDALKYVKLPVGGDDKFSTGVVFSDSKEHFSITQKVNGVGDITAPAKFIFASDGGVISAWLERKKDDGTFDRPAEAISVIDQSAEGAQFFGLAINKDYSRLYAADFGAKPALKVFDGAFKPASVTFDQPFDANKNGQVDAGEYAPFNVQTLTVPSGESHVFVAYAKTKACPAEEIKKKTCAKGEIFAGEEDTDKAGYGRLAEFTEEGKLVRVIHDEGKLSAPWGLAIAPETYGALAGSLLVGNFGSGHIAAYDLKSNQFISYLQGADKKPVVIEKLWGILFGNGQSLGDKDSLYFAAGPRDEQDGVFGRLRPVNAAQVPSQEKSK